VQYNNKVTAICNESKIFIHHVVIVQMKHNNTRTQQGKKKIYT